MVLKTLWYVDEEDAVETGEISLFVGHNFVVTVRHGAGAGSRRPGSDLEEQTEVLGHGPSAVVYAVCDPVVDDTRRWPPSLEEDVDEVEASVFSTEPHPRLAAHLHPQARAGRDAPRGHPAARADEPLRDRLGPGIPSDAAPFFRDVADHLDPGVGDDRDARLPALDRVRRAPGADLRPAERRHAEDLGLGRRSPRSPTLVAGIYGMNFDNMPELHWHFGYSYALGLMVLARSSSTGSSRSPAGCRPGLRSR